MAEATQLQPAPLQSPVFDRTGRMTAEWQRYFMTLFLVSQNVATSVVTITDSVTDLASATLLDSRNPQDVGAIAEEAAAGVPSDTPRDFSPLIEEALLESLAPSAKDFSPEIEAAVRSVLQPLTPQVTRADLDELNSRLVMIESVNRGSAANASTTDFDAVGAAEEISRQQAQQLFKDFSPEIEAAVRSVVESVPQVTRADLDELNARLVMIESVNRGSAANASTTDFDAVGAAEEISRQQAQQLFKDFSPEIEAAVRSVVESVPQVTRADLDELNARLVMIESVNRGSAANASTTDFDAVGAAEEISRQQAQQLFKDFSPEIESAVRAVLQDAQTPRVVPADLDDLRALIAASDPPGNLGVNWNTWTPTVSASGAMTVSSLALQDSQFCVIGSLCFFKIQSSFFLGGTASSTMNYTLPLAASGVDTAITAYLLNPTNWVNAFGFISVANNRVQIAPSNAANWALTSGWVFVQGFYRLS